MGRVVDDIQPTLEQHEVTFSCEDSPVIVHADELRLEQVLQNLLQNAVKYSPDGRAITVRVRQQGTEAHIAVSDQGIGIPPEEHGDIFQPFVRGKVARQIAPGAGLGLYITSRVLEQHNGRVEIDSAPSIGSTFRLRLPFVRPADA